MLKIIDIISQLRQMDGSFPKQEQKVATHVIENLETVAYQKQDEIAEASGVSVATVNRFCQTLGCEGFKDFKIQLVQSVAISLQYLRAPSTDNSESGQLAGQIFQILIDTLSIARNQLDGEAMETAIDALATARRINFFGVGGGSSNAAREGANRFFRLGIPSEAHSDGYFQRMLASTLTAGDVIFLISSSGTPRELLDSVTIARQYGAKTISLTKTGSELAQSTDISIEIDIPEDQDIYKPSASRLVFIAIIDVLAAGAARKRPDQVKENLRRIRTSLLPLSKDVGATPVGD
ncbi:MAG: MurR/RpiR family transcriptional regulator [Sneathiella sp.]